MIGGIKRGYRNLKELISVLVPAGIEVVKSLVTNKPVEPPMPSIKPPPSHSRAMTAPERDRERSKRALDGVK